MNCILHILKMNMEMFLTSKYLGQNLPTNAATGWQISCLSEHKASKCLTLGCYGKDRLYSKFPRELQVNLHRGILANNAGRWSRVRQHSEESDEDEDDEEESN